MQILEGSEYEEYKHTSLAGRVAAASGLARLTQMATTSQPPLSTAASWSPAPPSS